MTENLWMLAMLGMFGLFLWSLQTEARRSIRAIARDEDDGSWRAELHLAMAQRNARLRLAKMRADEAKCEAARRNAAEREAYRAAQQATQQRRTRWQIDAQSEEEDFSGEAFGDQGFTSPAARFEDEEFYAPLLPFNELLGRLAERRAAGEGYHAGAAPLVHN